MSRHIYRKIIRYVVFKNQTQVTLNCEHTFIDYVQNKWKIDQKVSCNDCLINFQNLEKDIVTDKEGE
jgi:hypothetical protein